MVEKKKKTRSTSSSVDPATQYARDVDSGKEIAGPDIRNSCKRHLKDLESCHARGLVPAAEDSGGLIRLFLLRHQSPGYLLMVRLNFLKPG
nr:hypothetical protein [Klebsiella michiganensis]